MKERLISPSAFKGFLECEAKQKAMDQGLWEIKETDAMRAGKLFEAILCEDENELPDGVYKKNGEPYAWARAAIADAEKIKTEVKRLNLFNNAEFQVKTESAMIHGIPDVVTDDAVIEIKYVKDFESKWIDGVKVPWWYASKYHIQLAFYAQLIPGKKYFLLAGTKQDPADKILLEFSEEMLDQIYEEEVVFKIEKFFGLRNSEIALAKKCGKCDFCRSRKKLEIEKAEIGEI